MPPAFSHWIHGRDYRIIDCGSDENILFIAGNHRTLRVSNDLGQRLREGLSALTAAEVTDWNALASSGLLSEQNAARVRSSTFMDGANLAINITLTAFCNLGCSYCFAEGGDYGRIKGKLESDTVADILAFAKKHVTPSQTVRFEFFGGEPLLNFPRIQE